jgi:hypothetical protein
LRGEHSHLLNFWIEERADEVVGIAHRGSQQSAPAIIRFTTDFSSIVA